MTSKLKQRTQMLKARPLPGSGWALLKGWNGRLADRLLLGRLRAVGSRVTKSRKPPSRRLAASGK